MRFVDEATIQVRAGKGGHGCVSFRREKFVPRGGPDGGDGGKGGSIVLQGDKQYWTLIHLKYQRHQFAEDGEHGSGARSSGKDAKDIIIPVPLAKKRVRQRGYNQSDLIAEGLAQTIGLPMRTDIIMRTSFKRSQTAMTTEQRELNVKDAFVLLKPEDIRGKHIILVDDVVTTGATVCSIGKELEKAGDVKISIVSWGAAFGTF